MFRKLHKIDDEITVYIDDVPIAAEVGESVAAILLRQPQVWSRTTPISGAVRGPYCMMGVCFECLATVSGVSSTLTCLTQAHDGMCIERQPSLRSMQE